MNETGHTPTKIIKSRTTLLPTHLTFAVLIKGINSDPNKISIEGTVFPPSDPTHAYPILQILQRDPIYTFPTTATGGFPGLTSLTVLLVKATLGARISLAEYEKRTEKKKRIIAGGSVVVTITNDPETMPTPPMDVEIPVGDDDEVTEA